MIRNKQLPEEGFNVAQIEKIVNDFAAGDTNNFIGKVGAGGVKGAFFHHLVSLWCLYFS